jgi:UDP-N-acetylmuramoyl-tripeptide--D-alanyl-D-alanine ligase
MIAFTAAEIAEITNGRLDADPGITPLSVVMDSRDTRFALRRKAG